LVVELKKTRSQEPGWTNEDCGQILTQYRHGSLEGKREKGDHFTLDMVAGSQ